MCYTLTPQLINDNYFSSNYCNHGKCWKSINVLSLWPKTEACFAVFIVHIKTFLTCTQMSLELNFTASSIRVHYRFFVPKSSIPWEGFGPLGYYEECLFLKPVWCIRQFIVSHKFPFFFYNRMGPLRSIGFKCSLKYILYIQRTIGAYYPLCTCESVCKFLHVPLNYILGNRVIDFMIF